MAATKKVMINDEAQRLTERLIKWGFGYEEIAYRVRVSVNSIIRWRKGMIPQPGHLTALREFYESVKNKKKNAKKAAVA
jgi:hypothetical protein